MANRTRSSPQVRQTPQRASGPVIIHFTSLSKYNHVRDTISSMLGGSVSSNPAFVHPEVIVIPKPVGPRRFLTALHTASSRPVVDPFFSPIATSPRSPGGGYFASRTPGISELGRDNGYFEGVPEDELNQGQRQVSDSSSGSQKGRSPLGEFPPSQASVVRTETGLHLSIPTPGDVMATPAHEYFESAVSRASSGSGSAVIMQSPDGRPMGMFFEPPNRDNRRISYNRRGSDRRMSGRRASGTGPDDEQAQGDSPRTQQQSRQSSQQGEGPSRRGSLKDANALSRAASRRKTLPTPTSGNEPILAMGRDRSSTNASRSRGPQMMSPVKVVGAGNTGTVQPKAKASKSTPMPAINDAEPASRPKSKSGAAKKTGQDSVVPPINVLIVEGMW
jgi:osomolarity two-component system response regulator SSK1